MIIVAQTEGQRALIETGASLRTIGRACGVSHPTAGGWRDGSSFPSEHDRERIFEAFGITPPMWEITIVGGREMELVPSTSNGTTAERLALAEYNAKRAAEAKASALDKLRPNIDPSERKIPKYPEAPPPDAGTLANLRYSLECIRHDITYREPTLTARSKLRSDEARTLALLSKLERDEELSESRYVKEHPAFREHCRRMLAALEPYPEASQAVIDALEA